MHDVPVLMYHSISTSAAPRFSRFVVHPSEFAAHMHYLAEAGYQALTAAGLARKAFRRDVPGRAVVLTFDDAYADFEHAVMPVLEECAFSATLYVPTAYVGGTALWLRDCNEEERALLSWDALRDIASQGIEVASHSHTHPQLDRVPITLVNDELRQSRLRLEDNLGVAVEGFAYPFGYWNRSVRIRVSAAGYSYACAVGELAAAPESDRLTIPRITVPGGVGLAGFAGLVASRSTAVTRVSSDLKRRAWAALRSHIRVVGGDPRTGDPSLTETGRLNAGLHQGSESLRQRRIARSEVAQNENPAF